MREFYPEIEPFDLFTLSVPGGHELYVEQVGNPKGRPVLFLHGGPGAGLSPKHRRFFDPKKYRVVLMDQRGAGKSKPFAGLENNTTWDLVADIERVRERLQIKNWIVFGGSWGSTLALSYAVTHPAHVQGLVLRGIFLCRPEEIRWFYQEGAHQIFPEEWERYVEIIPAEERGDLVGAYHRRLTSDDKAIRLQAAQRWSEWEGATLKLRPDLDTRRAFGADEMAPALARIECHYFMNNAFFETDNFLIEQVGKIRHIPSWIVHGRYDAVCPVKNAWDLHRAWPEAHLCIVPDAGHAADEPGIRTELIRIMDEEF